MPIEHDAKLGEAESASGERLNNLARTIQPGEEGAHLLSTPQREFVKGRHYFQHCKQRHGAEAYHAPSPNPAADGVTPAFIAGWHYAKENE